MAEGVIKKLFSDKGYGFIKSIDGESDHFFHCSNIARGYQFAALLQEQSVRFELAPDRKNPRKFMAINVQPFQFDNNKTASTLNEHQQSSTTTVLPYGFVPIDCNLSVTDTPVWHDGSSGSELLSGEIRCTLEALTPLLPGNIRYPIRSEGKDYKVRDGDIIRIHFKI